MLCALQVEQSRSSLSVILMRPSSLGRPSPRHTSRRVWASESLLVNVYPAVIESLPSYPHPFSCHDVRCVHSHQLVALLHRYDTLAHVSIQPHCVPSMWPVRPVRHACCDPHILVILWNRWCVGAVYVRHAACLLLETLLYSVILSALDPRKCEYLKGYSLDFEHAYMTTYLASWEACRYLFAALLTSWRHRDKNWCMAPCRAQPCHCVVR